VSVAACIYTRDQTNLTGAYGYASQWHLYSFLSPVAFWTKLCTNWIYPLLNQWMVYAWLIYL